ncbi:MAG: orotidine-5'-phosphate decarboxylase [Pseudomonadota bacterium]
MSETNIPIRPFADRLVHATRELGPLCVGIDPHFGKLPPIFGPDGPGALALWGEAIVQRVVGKAAVVKPQAGLFERWGAAGVAALEHVCRAARDAGLIVILDAKRGDIGSTAMGYAQAYLGPTSACPCDAITVNPYMGVETLEPFIALAEAHGKGVAVLARTSNPGSADFQARLVDGDPLYIRVAQALAPMIDRLKGVETSWSGLMLVAGATGPEEAEALRSAAPEALFLTPGYGAQGAGARAALAGYVKGPNGLEGGVVNASRSVTLPQAAYEAETAEKWNAAIDAAILDAQADLKAAALA